MLIQYIQAALRHADYKKLEDGTWFAAIPEFEGVWANAATVEDCRSELEEVLGDWLILKIRDRDHLPTVDGLMIDVQESAA
jgi:predicted RNase H-like HicB family nuclease